MPNEYTDIERSLLQFIIGASAVPESEVVKVFTKFKKTLSIDEDGEEIRDEDQPAETLERINRSLEFTIRLINTKLHDLGYTITKVVSQVSEEAFYVYVNRVSDEPAKISMLRSPKEISIIKRIIEHIITDSDDESFIITTKDALKLCSIEGFTSSISINFLQSLVNEGWFNLSESGQYSLSIRALAELKPMLIEKYGIKTLENDSEGLLNICIGCRDLVTYGLRCQNTECNARFHRHCYIYYTRAHGTECPNPECGIDWAESEPLTVGPSK